LSSVEGSQVPSPQGGHAPQSDEHVLQSSVPLQMPSPQDGHAPQSDEHVLQSSVALQVPSPQRGAWPICVEQFVSHAP